MRKATITPRDRKMNRRISDYSVARVRESGKPAHRHAWDKRQNENIIYMSCVLCGASKRVVKYQGAKARDMKHIKYKLSKIRRFLKQKDDE